jgi:CPA1 family monovalent cation:H+ antiporter
MDWFELAALLICLAAIASYLNARFVHLPTTIGLMAISLAASLGVVAIGSFVPHLHDDVVHVVVGIHFSETLMHGLLGFLLFAGALHIDLADLAKHKLAIGALATIGLLLSTFVIGSLAWATLAFLDMPLPWLHCLLFGALISPTDPIAVLALLASLGAPKSMETKIAGESLFNDGVGVVVFVAVTGAAGLRTGHASVEIAAHGLNALELSRLFVVETGGGVAFGLAAGYVAYLMLKSLDDYPVEVLISLALVAGGYAFAQHLHVSAPIAMVVAGLLIGNHGRLLAMSARTREHLDSFWELVDEILNAVLFVLIGLEVLVIRFEPYDAALGVLAIVITLAGRAIAVAAPLRALRAFRDFSPHAVKVLTWSGLRGGISVALALSLKGTLGVSAPDSYGRILFMTYVVVAFSIIVQGLTVAPLLRRLGLATR